MGKRGYFLLFGVAAFFALKVGANNKTGIDKNLKNSGNNFMYIIPNRGLIYAAKFREVEKKYNLPQNLLARIAQQESNFDPAAISHADAQGLMQIVPRWHPAMVGKTFDPFASIEYAGQYMRQLLNRYDDVTQLALMAYNWGMGNVDKWLKDTKQPMPKETYNYYRQILKDV